MNKFIIYILSILAGYGVVWYAGQQSVLPSVLMWDEWWPMFSSVIFVLLLLVVALVSRTHADAGIPLLRQCLIYAAEFFCIFAFSIVLGRVVFGNWFFYLWLQNILLYFTPSARQVLHVINHARHDAEED